MTADEIVKEWKDDLEKNPIGVFAFSSHTPPFSTLDIEELSVKNSRRQDAATVYADLETAISYKVDWERELERRNALGIMAPAPLPHPDDIVIDMATGLVRVKGPMTKEEKAVWDRFRERKKECDETIAELEAMLRNEPNYPYRDAVLDEIEGERKIKAIISRAIPD